MKRQSSQPSEQRIEVRRFLIYVVGLYLNLRLLRESYNEYVLYLRNLKDDDLFDLMERGFYDPKYGLNCTLNQALQAELSQFVEIDFANPEFSKFKLSKHQLGNLASLKEIMRKYANAGNIKEESKKTKHINIYKHDFLAAFISKNSKLSSQFPTLSGYLFLQINRDVLMKYYRDNLIAEINKTQSILDDGIVELCIKRIGSLLRIRPDSPPEKMIAKTNKAKLQKELRKVLLSKKEEAKEYRIAITKLYAKLSIYYNIPSVELAVEKISSFQIYLKHDEFFNLFANSILKKTYNKEHERIRAEAIDDKTFNATLIKLFLKKIDQLSKQINDNNDIDVDPVQFATELNGMVSFILLPGFHPDVFKNGRRLLEKTLAWLENELDKQNIEPIYYNILACLTFYAVVWDIKPVDLIAKIRDISKRKEIDYEMYKSALEKFSISPKRLALEFHQLQHEALIDKLKSENDISIFHLFKSDKLNKLQDEEKYNATLQEIKSVLLPNVESKDHQLSAYDI